MCVTRLYVYLMFEHNSICEDTVMCAPIMHEMDSLTLVPRLLIFFLEAYYSSFVGDVKL